MKYILVVGGVISGVGKGIIAGSTGALLKSKGYKLTFIKIDPYVNIDAGTLTPFDHGEVFVLNDGGESDLDLGNYERFLGISLTRNHNITTGKVYQSIISKERKGEYLGKTVQIVPHLTALIQDWIVNVSEEKVKGKGFDETQHSADICIIELGGTVGDIESLPFVESLRQLKNKVGNENFFIINVAYVPILASGEQKTKPIQNSALEMRKLGLYPNLIVARSSKKLAEYAIEKISNFGEVPLDNVIGIQDCKSTYEVPKMLENQMVFNIIKKSLKLNDIQPFSVDLVDLYYKFAITSFEQTVKIAIVGKYTDLKDAYTSLVEAIKFSAFEKHTNVDLVWIESTSIEENPEAGLELVRGCNGVIVPGGFGSRGIEGKILAAKYCREKGIPFFGICLGLQIAIIEVSRNLLNICDATSEEFDCSSNNKVIIYMPNNSSELGGTMRLGLHKMIFNRDGLLKKIYGNCECVYERHRHRYEVNPEYVENLENVGIHFVGRDTSGKRMEAFELKNHRFFVGVQFHPEYLATPTSPHPLFSGFVEASLNC